MKRVIKWILRPVCLGLALVLAAAVFPYAKDWLQGLLPQGKYEQTVALLSHQMEKAGELTAVTYQDTGVMESNTSALLIGNVQQVKAPYSYKIGLGINLDAVELIAGDTEITVRVPEAKMIYDSFQITDDPKVSDFWYHLTEERYQQMINAQALACRAGYLESGEYLDAAWDAACEALDKLLAQWAGESLPLRYERLPQTEDTGAGKISR